MSYLKEKTLSSKSSIWVAPGAVNITLIISGNGAFSTGTYSGTTLSNSFNYDDISNSIYFSNNSINYYKGTGNPTNTSSIHWNPTTSGTAVLNNPQNINAVSTSTLISSNVLANIFANFIKLCHNIEGLHIEASSATFLNLILPQIKETNKIKWLSLITKNDSLEALEVIKMYKSLNRFHKLKYLCIAGMNSAGALSTSIASYSANIDDFPTLNSVVSLAHIGGTILLQNNNVDAVAGDPQVTLKNYKKLFPNLKYVYLGFPAVNLNTSAKDIAIHKFKKFYFTHASTSITVSTINSAIKTFYGNTNWYTDKVNFYYQLKS